VFWRDFKTATAARTAIRGIVDAEEMLEPFYSDLISDLILERHYFCSEKGFRPSRFRKLPGYNAYNFQGDFTHCAITPKITWHTVSWDKCLKPWPLKWDWIVRAMRDRCLPEKTAYRVANAYCENCFQNPAADVHHENPSFISLTNTIRSQISEQEIDECLGEWNWFHDKNFQLPEEHKVTVLFDAAHGSAHLKSLCKACHNSTKRKF
jgi:hypothetical protein